MNTNSLRIRLLEPRAKKFLNELATLKLIKIETNNSQENEFAAILKKLRSNKLKSLSLDEISNEVEQVRTNRYGNFNN